MLSERHLNVLEVNVLTVANVTLNHVALIKNVDLADVKAVLASNPHSVETVAALYNAETTYGVTLEIKLVTMLPNQENNAVLSNLTGHQFHVLPVFHV